MKILISFFCLLMFSGLYAQKDFYDWSIVSSSGEVVNMSKYKGKKLLIVVVDRSTLTAKSPARYLGSLQKKYPDIEVLVLPSNVGTDSTATAEIKTDSALARTKFSLPVASGREKVADRHPFLQWLTVGTKNGHFDTEVLGDEQYYVINESGILYAALSKEVSDSFLDVVLKAAEAKIQ